MSLPTLQLLSSNISDFIQNAKDVEDRIRDLDLKHDSFEFVQGQHGRRHHDMWTSLKTVSHFNLGVALELLLKLILMMGRVSCNKTHKIADLYQKLPEYMQERINLYYTKCMKECMKDAPDSLMLIAFMDTPNVTPPPHPCRQKIDSLKGFLIYLDEDLKIWERRYSWEYIDRQEWCHYINDVEPIRVFIQIVLTFCNRHITANLDLYSRENDSQR